MKRRLANVALNIRVLSHILSICSGNNLQSVVVFAKPVVISYGKYINYATILWQRH